MKSVLYRDQHPKLWEDLIHLQAAAMDYVKPLGLELVTDESEGYAYLRQIMYDEQDGNALPRLVQRRPLSYPVSLLCVLLREKLVEADAGGGDVRVILSKEQIVELMQTFLPLKSNEAKLMDQIETYINKVVDLGFLRKLKTDRTAYEVRRILKAFVDADWLADMDDKLKVYREYALSQS
ncbi:hypothetical protein BMS3Abin06_02250 [bacterium BMS3Abin06]|nr:hypothetical protein BMS3Abin06_02250 [bacterium BMS3Abin06]